MRKSWSASGTADADAGVILMVVGALEFDALAVQEKSLVGVKADGADAEGRLIAVHHGVRRADQS